MWYTNWINGKTYEALKSMFLLLFYRLAWDDKWHKLYNIMKIDQQPSNNTFLMTKTFVEK